MSDSTIIMIAAIAGVAAVSIAAVFSQGTLLKGITTFIEMVIRNQALTESLGKQAAYLPDATRKALEMLADVADPLTKTTATELDDETVAWLRSWVSAARPDEKPSETKSIAVV